MSGTAILSSNFRISIPEQLRVARGWRPGQELAFIPKGAGLLLIPVPARSELEGMAKGARAIAYRDR